MSPPLAAWPPGPRTVGVDSNGHQACFRQRVRSCVRIGGDRWRRGARCVRWLPVGAIQVVAGHGRHERATVERANFGRVRGAGPVPRAGSKLAARRTVAGGGVVRNDLPPIALVKVGKHPMADSRAAGDVGRASGRSQDVGRANPRCGDAAGLGGRRTSFAGKRGDPPNPLPVRRLAPACAVLRRPRQRHRRLWGDASRKCGGRHRAAFGQSGGRRRGRTPACVGGL